MKLSSVYIADFETITAETKYFQKHKKSGIVYGYLENLENNKNYEFITIDDMFWWLTNKHKRDLVVFFHNLSFDGVFIVDWLGKNGCTLSDELVNEKDFTIFRTTGSKIYKIQVAYKPNKCRKIRRITFCCSMLILSSSVAALGKNSKLNKYLEGQDTPEFYNREPQKSLGMFKSLNSDYCEYCIRDVKIVKQALLDFYKSINEFLISQGLEEHMKDIYTKTTISSISLFLQEIMMEKHGHLKDEMYLHYIDDRITMDKFTAGGLTIVNEDYKEQLLDKIEGNCIDLKSAYPAVMSGVLPYGDMLYEKPYDYDSNLYVCFQEIYYEKIWAKNHNIPLLKNWGNQLPRYFLRAEEYTTYLLDEEAEVLEQLHNFEGKKIIKQYWFRKKIFLKEFIDNMFYYKEKYKKENELGKSHTFKILLNSGYGIHAKRNDYKIVVPFQACDIIERKDIEYHICDNIDLNHPDRHTFIPNNPIFAYKPNFEKAKISLIAHKGIANYITAQTRIKIMKGIIHFKPKHFLYCDTDSLFLIGVKKEEILKYCGDKLGDWEYEEKSFDSGIFSRPKLYQTYQGGNIIKSGNAGIRKGGIDHKHLQKKREEARLIGDNSALYLLPNAALIPHRVDGGIVLVSTSKYITLFSHMYDESHYTKEEIEKYNKSWENMRWTSSKK